MNYNPYKHNTRYKLEFDGDCKFFNDLDEALKFAEMVIVEEEAEDVSLFDGKTNKYLDVRYLIFCSDW